MPSTLESSYLKSEYWVFEVEALIREGIGRLRRDADDRAGATMLAEAYKRLLEQRWMWQRAKDKKFGWRTRFVKPGPREAYHNSLESMAQGALIHYGWRDLTHLAAEAARAQESGIARVGLRIVVSIDPPCEPNVFESWIPDIPTRLWDLIPSEYAVRREADESCQHF